MEEIRKSLFEVFVTWVGHSPMTSQFYNVRKGDTVQGSFAVRPRLGVPGTVTIVLPEVEWMTISDGHPLSSVPPFDTVLEVRTDTLEEGHIYECQVMVTHHNIILATKLIRVHIENPEIAIVEIESPVSWLSSPATSTSGPEPMLEVRRKTSERSSAPR